MSLSRWSLLSLLLLSTAVAGAQTTSMLLVIGEVTTNSVRILFEKLDHSLPDEISIALRDSGSYGLLENRLVPLEFRPRIVQFSNLKPNTEYIVEFTAEDQVQFSTMPSNPANFEFIVASCNGFNVDGDLSLWKQMQNSSHTANVMLMLGDQIYADWIVESGRHLNSTYDELLEHFRNTYRQVWGEPTLQSILRRTPIWTIPDDHEIMDNLRHAYVSNSSLELVLKAGRQAYIEYQHRLREDVPDNDDDFSIFTVRRVNDIVWIFVDDRWERTFRYDVAYPLFGARQWTWLEQVVPQYGMDDSVKTIFLVSSFPLGFGTAWLADIAEKYENETLGSNPVIVTEITRLFDLFLPFVDKTTILAGDIHMYFEAKVCLESSRCMNEVVTSGLTEYSTSLNSHKLLLFDYFAMFLSTDKFSDSWDVHYKRAFMDRNYVVVTVDPKSTVSWLPMLIHTSHLTYFQRAKQMLFDAGPWARTGVAVAGILILHQLRAKYNILNDISCTHLLSN